eukprot:jgi/Hompol1/2559/HPOL_005654-RA
MRTRNSARPRTHQRQYQNPNQHPLRSAPLSSEALRIFVAAASYMAAEAQQQHPSHGRRQAATGTGDSTGTSNGPQVQGFPSTARQQLAHLAMVAHGADSQADVAAVAAIAAGPLRRLVELMQRAGIAPTTDHALADTGADADADTNPRLAEPVDLMERLLRLPPELYRYIVALSSPVTQLQHGFTRLPMNDGDTRLLLADAFALGTPAAAKIATELTWRLGSAQWSQELRWELLFIDSLDTQAIADRFEFHDLAVSARRLMPCAVNSQWKDVLNSLLDLVGDVQSFVDPPPDPNANNNNNQEPQEPPPLVVYGIDPTVNLDKQDATMQLKQATLRPAAVALVDKMWRRFVTMVENERHQIAFFAPAGTSPPVAIPDTSPMLPFGALLGISAAGVGRLDIVEQIFDMLLTSNPTSATETAVRAQLPQQQQQQQQPQQPQLLFNSMPDSFFSSALFTQPAAVELSPSSAFQALFSAELARLEGNTPASTSTSTSTSVPAQSQRPLAPATENSNTRAVGQIQSEAVVPTSRKRSAEHQLSELEQQRRDRMLRNRVSAQESRIRKKQQADELRRQNEVLRQQNEALSLRLQSVESSNSHLVSRLDLLMSQLTELVALQTQSRNKDNVQGNDQSQSQSQSQGKGQVQGQSQSQDQDCDLPELLPRNVASSSSSSSTSSSSSSESNLLFAHPEQSSSTCEPAAFTDPQQWVPHNGLSVSKSSSSSIQAHSEWLNLPQTTHSLLPSSIATTAKSLCPTPLQTLWPCLTVTLDSTCEMLDDSVYVSTLPTKPLQLNWEKEEPSPSLDSTLSSSSVVVASEQEWRRSFPIAAEILLSIQAADAKASPTSYSS